MAKAAFAGVRPGILTILLLLPASVAFAQGPATPPDPADEDRAWSFDVSVATYVLDEEENYAQPTVAADCGALHLESRYNYEEKKSVSGFAGWNLSAGKTVTVDVTPMFGAVTGQLFGVIPGLELTVAYRGLSFYSEGEYVIDLKDTSSRFLYSWSELSLQATGWLRAGFVAQRTRVFEESRDIQRGLLTGVTVGPIEAVAYFFNPGSDDYYFVASVRASF